MKVLVTQLCSILCDPIDCSPPGSSVHRILQARTLEWVAISFSMRSSWSRDWTQVTCIAGRSFTYWATKEDLKSFKLDFKGTQNENGQRYNVGLEKAEKPEIKLPTSDRKSKGSPEKHLLLLHWYMCLCVDHNKLWKILKEMAIPDHFTCLLRNLYAGREATGRTGHETKNGSK